MKEVYDWIRNLVGYLLFLAVLEQLLPEKQYVKYVNLFAGMVFLLLAVQPFADGTGLVQRIAGSYRELEFQSDTRDLRQDVSGAVDKQRSRLLLVYEQAVAEDVRQMAEELDLAVHETDVTICGAEGTEAFGTVTHIRVTAGHRDGAEGGLTDKKAAKLRASLRSCYHLEDADVEIGAVEGER